MKLYLIRHLKTRGNYERMYIGRTDESIYEAEKQEILDEVPVAEAVFSSPMKRCLETTELIIPGSQPIIKNGLREIDFGDFENKSYEELKDNPDYIKFIDSNGNGMIPNGESTTVFKQRCCNTFLEIIDLMVKNQWNSSIIICHGGTIMSILEQFDEANKSFYDYQVKNGSGFEIEFNIETQKIKMVRELV